MPTAVLLAPFGAATLYKRLATALSGVDVASHDFDASAELTPDFLTREAKRLAAVALTEPTHLVAHSGGASVSLVIATSYPERLRSLTLIEPPWIGNDPWSTEECEFCSRYDALAGVEPARFWEAFARLLSPDAPETPRDPAPGAGALQKEIMMGIWQIYRSTPFDRSALSRVTAPVLLPYGSQSGAHARAVADTLAAALPDACAERFDDCHHFDLPYRASERLAGRLRELWGMS